MVGWHISLIQTSVYIKTKVQYWPGLPCPGQAKMELLFLRQREVWINKMCHPVCDFIELSSVVFNSAAMLSKVAMCSLILGYFNYFERSRRVVCYFMECRWVFDPFSSSSLPWPQIPDPCLPCHTFLPAGREGLYCPSSSAAHFLLVKWKQI